MPVYGYRCSRGHQFEVNQRITEAPLATCSECGAPVRRVVYPVGVIFKGGGFYKTDSRGASSDGSVTGADTKTDTKTDTKSETKSDSKSETKPDSKRETKSETKAPAKTEEKSSPKEGAA
jgi:putative FmdB family regulatory protein